MVRSHTNVLYANVTPIFDMDMNPSSMQENKQFQLTISTDGIYVHLGKYLSVTSRANVLLQTVHVHFGFHLLCRLLNL